MSREEALKIAEALRAMAATQNGLTCEYAAGKKYAYTEAAEMIEEAVAAADERGQACQGLIRCPKTAFEAMAEIVKAWGPEQSLKLLERTISEEMMT